MHHDIAERKSDNIFFNACLYISGKLKEPVVFVSMKALWFLARNNNCGTIAHKIGTSATSLLHCMEDGAKP